MSRRLTFILVVVVVIAIGTIFAVRSSGEYPSDGPLPVTATVEIAWAVETGAATTWGMPLPTTTMDGVVETVDLVDARGVDVLGIQACVGATLETDGTYTHCAPSNASAWPPSGVALRPVEGAPLPRDPRDPTGILVGLRRQPGFAEGTVRAVRITYSVDTSTYQVVEPWSVRLTDDPPELQSPGSAS